MSPTVRDEGMTHHVGDDCHGGHMESLQPDTRAVVQQLVDALERQANAKFKDCVKFGRHEVCSRGKKCAYRQADAALTAGRAWREAGA